MFAAVGFTPLEGLLRFDLRAPVYDVNLAKLAPCPFPFCTHASDLI